MTQASPFQQLAKMLYIWCNLDVTPSNLQKLRELKLQCHDKKLDVKIDPFALFQLLEPRKMDEALMEELFYFLIAKGVDYRSQCAIGNLLHMCVARNRQSIFDFLLDKQLNVNEVNIHGWTPLHKAITTNHIM